MSGPEGTLETYFRGELMSYGFKVVKFVPDSAAGSPDRWIFRPKWSPGAPMLVELKAPGKKPRKLQRAVIDDYAARGVKVLPYIASKVQADATIYELVWRAVRDVPLYERVNLPPHITRAASQYDAKIGFTHEDT